MHSIDFSLFKGGSQYQSEEPQRAPRSNVFFELKFQFETNRTGLSRALARVANVAIFPLDLAPYIFCNIPTGNTNPTLSIKILRCGI